MTIGNNHVLKILQEKDVYSGKSINRTPLLRTIFMLFSFLFS